MKNILNVKTQKKKKNNKNPNIPYRYCSAYTYNNIAAGNE